jgi:hypothetical protein
MYYHTGAAQVAGRDAELSQEKIKIRMKVSFMLYNPTLTPSNELKK